MVKKRKRPHSRFLRLTNFFLLVAFLLIVSAVILQRYYDVDVKAEVIRLIRVLQTDDEGADGRDNHSKLPGENGMSDQYGDWSYYQPGAESADDRLATDRRKEDMEKNSSSASRDRSEKDEEENPSGNDKQSEGDTLRLEPKPEESTPELLNLVESFSKWMEYQHRRSGHKYISKAFAKKQDEACFLYLKVVDGFVKQRDDWMEQTTRGIWEYWAEKLQSRGIINEQDDAYVILLNGDGKPVGGSRRSKPNKLWWN